MVMVCNNKKKKIMHAVEKLAAGQRLYEITLDDVVKEAKIGKGTVYHYFKNKEDLFFEVATNGFDELCELLQQEVYNDASFTIKFSHMCHHIIQFFANRQQLLQIMQAHAAQTYWSKSSFRERWTSRRKALVNIVSNILSAGVAEGQIRSDLSTDFLANSLLSILRAYVRDYDAYSNSIRDGQLLMDLFLSGACKSDSRAEVHCLEAFQADK
jgi:AcrR family transcriptional regulator